MRTTLARSPKSLSRVLSPKRSTLSSVCEDDSGSINGGHSVYSAGVGHDDPTAVMGNVKHTQSQLSVGTISSFMTTEQDRDIEAREPHEGTDIINVNFIHDMENSDLREQLYELDQAANSWTSRHSQLSGDSSETERFYVSEAGNNGSPRLWQQRERKPLPETIEEQSEMSNGSEQDDGQDQNIAMEAAVAFSPCLGFEQEVVFEDTKGFGYISSDYSHGSNEQASTIQSVVSDVSQKECLEVNDDTGILSATSSNGSPSHMKEIVRQVQKLLLGSPAVEIGTDSNSIEIAKRPDPRPSTPSEQESSFENQVHIPFIFEQVSQDSENVEFIEAKSRARRRQFVCYSFLCLVMIGLVLALLFFLKEDRRFSHDRFIDSSAALATAEPSQYVDANPSSHPSFAPVENLTGNPTLPSGSTQSPPSREQTLMPSAMTTTMSDSNPTPPRLRVPTPEPSVAPVQVPSASGTSLTAAPITATIPLSNSDTENEAFDAKTHLLGISGDLLNDPTTSQYDAYQWLINEDPANLDIDSIPIKSLEQRYISTLLYFSTQGSMWDDTFNFLTEVDVCDWKDSFTGKGIMCDSQGTIEEITINQNGLRGSIPFELQELTSMKRLELRTNRIGGSVPPQLGNLPSLEELDLRQNNLVGSFPESIFGLSNLRKLFMLQNTNLVGTIPASIENATSLEMISFQRCRIAGSLPSGIGMLSSLYFLTLLGNEMTGSVPQELTQLPNLEVLELAGNNFTGSIPEFADQPELYFLSLYENRLTGTIPESMGRLTSLLFFDIRDNELSGQIPNTFNDVPELVTFYAAGNQLTGSLPSFSGNVGFLQAVDLAQNQLSGDLGGFLSAGGPSAELHTINLASNLLSGSIPSTIGAFTRLASLILTDNGISGTIPLEIGGLQRLDTLLLSRNNLRGSIPEEMGQLGGLKYVDVSSNEFEGTLSKSLGALSQLSILDLSNNKISGSLPDTLQNLQDLDELYLQSNLLTGNFDSALCPSGDSSGMIGNFVADCGKSNPEVICSCCTACCSDVVGCDFT